MLSSDCSNQPAPGNWPRHRATKRRPQRLRCPGLVPSTADPVHRVSRPGMALLLGLLCSVGSWAGLTTAWGDATRVQSISMRAGWNAVFLEVQPEASKPAEVFAGLPVESVACFVPGRLEAQYLRNPGDAPWRDEGWAVWHAPSRAEAFLSNLYDIQAGRALLILANADFDWTITGEAPSSPLQAWPAIPIGLDPPAGRSNAACRPPAPNSEGPAQPRASARVSAARWCFQNAPVPPPRDDDASA